jgi:hypothetical protein
MSSISIPFLLRSDVLGPFVDVVVVEYSVDIFQSHLFENFVSQIVQLFH